MSKQAEIREGIAKHFRPHTLGDVEDDLSDFIDCSGTMELWRLQADELIQYLHTQGVVMKTVGELPDNPIWHNDEVKFEAYCAGVSDMIEAGYVATEPLLRRYWTKLRD